MWSLRNERTGMAIFTIIVTTKEREKGVDIGINDYKCIK